MTPPLTPPSSRPEPGSTGPVEDPQRYRVDDVRSFQRGGVGLVFRATTEIDGATVSVGLKMLTGIDVGRFEKLARRSELLSDLRHPHLARHLECFTGRPLAPGDVDDDDRLFYSAHQWVAGRSLFERVEAGDVDPDDLLRWLAELGEALDALHAAGFAHRDMHLRNVIITEPDSDDPVAAGRAVLIDFETVLWGDPTDTDLTSLAAFRADRPHDLAAVMAEDRAMLAMAVLRAAAGDPRGERSRTDVAAAAVAALSQAPEVEVRRAQRGAPPEVEVRRAQRGASKPPSTNAQLTHPDAFVQALLDAVASPPASAAALADAARRAATDGASRRPAHTRLRWWLTAAVAAVVVLVAAVVIVLHPGDSGTVADPGIPPTSRPTSPGSGVPGVRVDPDLKLDKTNFCSWHLGTHPIPLVSVEPLVMRVDARCNFPADPNPRTDYGATLYDRPANDAPAKGVGRVRDGEHVTPLCFVTGADRVRDSTQDPNVTRIWIRLRSAGAVGYLPDVNLGGGYTPLQLGKLRVEIC